MRLVQILILFSVVGLSGCASVISLYDPCPYGGVRQDVHNLTYNCHTGDFGCIGRVVEWPLSLIDLPLSAVLDTALLPVQSVRYFSLDKKERNYRCERR